MNYKKRTHTCGELSLINVGDKVILNGWVSQIRDLGGVIFINLRDRYGVTQLTFNPNNKESYNIAKELKNECVTSAAGTVQKRSSVNPKMKTGEIEILVDEIQILNQSDTPPFAIGGEIISNEDLRLKYRYLDLRNDELKNNLILRNEVTQVVHKYFHELGFVEIETPILMKSTPEGARDYLVPSRIHHGKFYALPQSPQTYKQILMIAGFDKYVQLCKCFRDEDLRADRQPEFTQIDLEMSFVTQEDVFEVVEGCMKEIWKLVKNIEIETPFPRLTYEEALFNYGIDKPDLRYGMKINHIWSLVRNTELANIIDSIPNGEIAGIKLEGIEVTRKILDELTEFVRPMGFGRLNFIKIQQNEISSSLKKYLNEEILQNIINKFEARAGDYILLLMGEPKKLSESLGKLRIHLAEEYLKDEKKNKFNFLWVTDFPLFHWDEKEGRYSPEHHPFTSPKDEYLKNLDSDKKEDILDIKADCYDLVLNGSELGSGSIRIHNSEIQSKIFKIIGLSEEEAKEKFGFMLEAFKYGAPPHGGAAFGFDRIVALLAGQTSIKEFIAFPKTTNAMSLMDGSPSTVDENQIKELGIIVRTTN
jgi:aspartyl-tRNA synthetase